MSDYDLDIYAWSRRQGALLRRLAAGERVNDADLDWPNIAEEIETVGRSERAAVRSHVLNVLEHLIKLQASPVTEPRAGWQATVERARIEIEQLLADSPSLRSLVTSLIGDGLPKARRLAATALALHGETPRVDLQALDYTEDQVLSDWLPPSP
ncbi:MAG TPA: DUF29 domain-containing protein [Acetobacteraceae bacterium]|jgi:hypothetical protein|nr:DUF29 domain-containing protein [Acetobacteraceae bacterium]